MLNLTQQGSSLGEERSWTHTTKRDSDRRDEEDVNARRATDELAIRLPGARRERMTDMESDEDERYTKSELEWLGRELFSMGIFQDFIPVVGPTYLHYEYECPSWLR